MGGTDLALFKALINRVLSEHTDGAVIHGDAILTTIKALLLLSASKHKHTHTYKKTSGDTLSLIVTVFTLAESDHG